MILKNLIIFIFEKILINQYFNVNYILKYNLFKIQNKK